MDFPGGRRDEEDVDAVCSDGHVGAEGWNSF